MTETPDTRPGPYYVSVIDAGKYALLSGPYDTHAAALADVDRCNRLLVSLKPEAHFYAFGTCRPKNGVSAPGWLQRAGYAIENGQVSFAWAVAK